MDRDHDELREELDALERELADVEAALERLENGTYWTDEVTGAPLAADVLEGDPLARRNPRAPGAG